MPRRRSSSLADTSFLATNPWCRVWRRPVAIRPSPYSVSLPCSSSVAGDSLRAGRRRPGSTACARLLAGLVRQGVSIVCAARPVRCPCPGTTAARHQYNGARYERKSLCCDNEPGAAPPLIGDPAPHRSTVIWARHEVTSGVPRTGNVGCPPECPGGPDRGRATRAVPGRGGCRPRTCRSRSLDARPSRPTGGAVLFHLPDGRRLSHDSSNDLSGSSPTPQSSREELLPGGFLTREGHTVRRQRGERGFRRTIAYG